MLRIRLPLLVATCIVASVARPSAAQKSSVDSAKMLWDRGMHAEAGVIIDRLIKEGSTVAEVHSLHAFVLLERSKVVDDSAVRRAMRVQAKSAFGRAIELGSASTQTKVLFAAIPADGGPDASFSKNPRVDSAMQAGEKSFAQHEFRAALTSYALALSLDPTEYSAQLFSGDAYVQLGLLDSGYIAYRAATVINPDRETAFRYWSGVLLKNGNPTEAHDRAIDAVVADPYSRLARTALSSWSQATRTPVGAPRVAVPVKDSSATPSRFWLAYDSARKAHGVDAAGHRHTMAEERDALLAASRVAPDDIAVLNIKRMNEAGQLESFVFFFRADAGIASEYKEYRATHREQLMKFWNEWVVGAKYSR